MHTLILSHPAFKFGGLQSNHSMGHGDVRTLCCLQPKGSAKSALKVNPDVMESFQTTSRSAAAAFDVFGKVSRGTMTKNTTEGHDALDEQVRQGLRFQLGFGSDKGVGLSQASLTIKCVQQI